MNISDIYGQTPDVCFVATSTGVLVRGLQIGWDKTKFYAVTVARNMKSGELGRAEPIIEPLGFQQSEKKENLPPFPTVNTYDAKVWMWNVGREPELQDPTIVDRIDSYRSWGEIRPEDN